MTMQKLLPIAFAMALLALTTPQRSFAAEDLASPETAAAPAQLAALGGDPFQALVTKVVHTVEWQRSHTHLWQPAAVENLLEVGDTLRTGAEAKAELLYGDGSVTRVGSQTSLTLSGTDHRELHLDGGRVWLHVIKHNAGMRVITPGAVAAVTGTELMVDFDPVRRTTEVTVFEGAVNVTGDVGSLVRVQGGTTTRVVSHAPAAAPVPLDNRKLQERENILKPLSVSTTTSEATPAPASGTTPKPASSLGPDAQASTAPAAVPTTAATTDTTTKPVQPDLKTQTDKLFDPRVINGSPTSGRVKVIIQ